jgi:hypothetical protein
MMVDAISADDLGLLGDTLRKAMAAASGQALDKALVELGWLEMLEEMPDTAIPLVLAVDDELPMRRVPSGDPVPLAAGRRALGWWLVGTSRTMLSLAREHALGRTQFGRPVASFQAIRHKLAETLVAIEGAEATLGAATDDFTSLLAKAAAGQAALTAARHCQQVLGGIGFTNEHELHRHIKRALVLDGLLGNARELTREAGATLRAQGSAPRLVDL